MAHEQLIDEYLAGPELLRRAVTDMSGDQLLATPIAGTWSTQSVVCHISDFEPVYLDRMKRVIVEDVPTFFGGDPDAFAARLAYSQRHIGEELDLVAIVRSQVGRILKNLAPGDFQRTGNHSEDGPLSLEDLLRRITGHIPHHVRFINQKRTALGLAAIPLA